MENVRISRTGLQLQKAAVRQLDFIESHLRKNVHDARSQMFDTQRLIKWVGDGKSFNDFEPAKSDKHGSTLDKTAGVISKLAQQRKRIITLLETLEPDEMYDLSLDDYASLGLEGLAADDSPQE